MKEDYYDIRAQEFYDGSVGADVHELYKPFLEFLPGGGRILDAGCGSGRDTKAFLAMGYEVDAIDASAEMARMATSYSGVTVEHRRFEEITARYVYDGIWACASLLHVQRSSLVEAISGMTLALKESGYLYASFKYGSREREEDGRTFTDMDELAIEDLLEAVEALAPVSTWVTQDVRPGRSQSWMNIICQRIDR
ncbi:MAG: class I SAM-dependent methyltransferase [Halioglobus sp.]